MDSKFIHAYYNIIHSYLGARVHCTYIYSCMWLFANELAWGQESLDVLTGNLLPRYLLRLTVLSIILAILYYIASLICIRSTHRCVNSTMVGLARVHKLGVMGSEYSVNVSDIIGTAVIYYVYEYIIQSYMYL